MKNIKTFFSWINNMFLVISFSTSYLLVFHYWNWSGYWQRFCSAWKAGWSLPCGWFHWTRLWFIMTGCGPCCCIRLCGAWSCGVTVAVGFIQPEFIHPCGIVSFCIWKVSTFCWSSLYFSNKKWFSCSVLLLSLAALFGSSCWLDNLLFLGSLSSFLSGDFWLFETEPSFLFHW